MAKTITLPAQPEFSRRTFAGQGGQDVPVYGYVFVMDDVHYRGESIGDHARDALKKAMTEGATLTIDDKDMEWNERFNVFKIKIAKEGGGGFGGKGGGGSWGKPRYQGKKLTGKEWVSTTTAVFTALYDAITAHVEAVDVNMDVAVTEARALTAQFWICVESGIIELGPAQASQSQAAQPTQPELPGGHQEPAAMVVFSQKLANATRQDEVIGIEQQISASTLSDEDKKALKRQAMQRKKSLAQRAAETAETEDIPF